MKLSASIEMVWQLAGQEAITGNFKEIEPEHILAAILKLSELPVEDAEKIAPGAEVAKQLAEEVGVIREELTARSIDSTSVRRQLREKLGKGNNKYDGGSMHRSQASRNIFDTAAKLADDSGSNTLMVIHLMKVLLTSPTPAMVQILGEGARKIPIRPLPSVLEEYGVDLTEKAANKGLPIISGRKAECRAILQAFMEQDSYGIFLVEEDEEVVRSIMIALAQTMVSEDFNSTLKGKRIFDLTAIKQDAKMTEFHLKFTNLLSDPGTGHGFILFLPPVDLSRTLTKADKWMEFIKKEIPRKELRFIRQMTSREYEGTKKDPFVRRFIRVIWIRKHNNTELPSEL